MPIKLNHILNRIHSLPALPDSAMQVIALTRNSETDIKDLIAVISHDPALTANILRQANSSYYGYARRISSLAEAVVILGFQAIQGLAMASALSPLLKTELIGYGLDQEGLWRHSMFTAMAGKRLCKRLLLPFGEVAFIAGLLHDIGKLILTVYVQEVGSFILKKVDQENLSYRELEKKIIGFDHATVGGYIAQQWNLPDELVEAITHHHTPERAQHQQQLAAIVHVANALANLLGVGEAVDSFLNPLQEQALSLLHLTEQDLELIMAELGDLLSDPTLFS
ncbi:MAG: HDOD domain-containing protein [Desulfitobacteriaceae bacterium]